MRPRDAATYARLDHALTSFREHPMPGIRSRSNRVALIEQMVESVHRVEFIRALQQRPISPSRCDPNSDLFDPLRAAILHRNAGNIDEAFWLVFLLVHFGKSPRGGWRYVQDIYGRLGDPERWNWLAVSASPGAFRQWLLENQEEIKPRCRFGNHRKYQSLDAMSNTGTGAAVETYVNWVGPAHSHQAMVQEVLQQSNSNASIAFESLYKSMKSVASFGRMARFDYLTMIGKLNLAPIIPNSAYISTATGPLTGARLLFGNSIRPSDLENLVACLGSHLRLGMQEMEDSLCNWAKSPGKFKAFRG